MLNTRSERWIASWPSRMARGPRRFVLTHGALTFVPMAFVNLLVNGMWNDAPMTWSLALRTLVVGSVRMLPFSLWVYGQELDDESYAICKADMLIKGRDIANIIPGNTLSNDGLPGKKFDYMLSTPPFGVEWKKIGTSTCSRRHARWPRSMRSSRR